MKKRFGFGVVLTVASLTGMAYGQGGGPATVGGRSGTTSSSSLVTAPNNLEQKANEEAERNGTPVANTAVPGVNTAAPAGTATVPSANTGAGINTAVPGSTETPAQTAGIGANTTPPGSNPATGAPGVGAEYATPGTINQGTRVGTTGNNGLNAAQGTMNRGTTIGGVADPGNAVPRGTMGTTGATAGYGGQGAGTPGATYTPGLANPGEWNYRTNSANVAGTQYQQGGYPSSATAATPGYTGREMPGMAGYNSVNPMGTTMAPPYYYAGSAGMPYATYSNPGYSSGYVNPGYSNTTYQNYNVRPRRGLFGRRNRVTYPANPYGYNTYSNGYSSPNGYTTYSNGYSSPYGYSSYGTTTYYSAPSGYSYGGYPN